MTVPTERFSPGKHPGETPGICKAKKDDALLVNNSLPAATIEIRLCLKDFLTPIAK
jgi:hypothetical protein